MSTANVNGNSKLDGNTLPGSSEQVDDAAKSGSRQIPDWLKPDLFVDLLRKNVPDFKAIKSFRANAAQGAGENYATLMGSVEMDVELENGKSKEVSYMIKLPIESVQKLMKKGCDIFTIENAVYRDVIPELERLYSDAGVEVKFAPKYYDIETPSEHGVILMEDLRQRGFKNANRLEGFDIEHTKSALKKLAQWHAATAVRVANKGKYPHIVGTGVMSEEFIALIKRVHAQGGQILTECAHTYAGNEVYIDRMKTAHEKKFDSFYVILNPDPNEFNVLNHGDFWSNNIMFQCDEFGKIKETYFVDYQCTRYCPPIQDLYNILLSSTQYEIKLKHFEYFVKFYHDNLIECLNLLKYPKKMPTLKEIHMQLYKYGNWGFSIAYYHMAIVLLDPTDSACFDNLHGTSSKAIEFKRLMYTNERYRKHAEVVFPWLYNRGAFE